MIYAASVLDSMFVKIGYADDVEKRMRSLQTGNPFEITPLFSVEGTLRQEQTLHHLLLNAFRRIRIPIPPNEWYPGKNPVFQQFLGNLRYGFGPAMAFLEAYDSNVKQPGMKAGREPLRPNIRWPRMIGKDRQAA